MVKPPFSRTTAAMRASSSCAIEVPVGLDGDASSTPRVASFQFSLTIASDSWKRSAGPLGIIRARPSKAATKCRLHG